MIGPRDNTGTLEPLAAVRRRPLALHLGTPIVVEGWLGTSTRRALQKRTAAHRREAASNRPGTNRIHPKLRRATASRANAASTRNRRRPRWRGATSANVALLGMAQLPPAGGQNRSRRPSCCGWQRDRPPARRTDSFVRDWANLTKGQRRTHRHEPPTHDAERCPKTAASMFPNALGAARRRMVRLRAPERRQLGRVAAPPDGSLTPGSYTPGRARGSTFQDGRRVPMPVPRKAPAPRVLWKGALMLGSVHFRWRLVLGHHRPQASISTARTAQHGPGRLQAPSTKRRQGNRRARTASRGRSTRTATTWCSATRKCRPPNPRPRRPSRSRPSSGNGIPLVSRKAVYVAPINKGAKVYALLRETLQRKRARGGPAS